MPRMCCVPGSKSNYRSQGGPTITTFAFPKEVHLNKKWVRCINRDNFTPGCAAVVCIKHFSEGCLIREDVATRDDGTKLVVQRERPKLKKGAVPTIFSNHPCYFTSETLKQCKDSEERADQVLRREDEPFESYSPLYNEEFAMKCRQMCQVHYEEPHNHEDFHPSPTGSTDQAGRSIDFVSCATIKEEPEQEWSPSLDEADPLQDGVEHGQNNTWLEQGLGECADPSGNFMKPVPSKMAYTTEQRAFIVKRFYTTASVTNVQHEFGVKFQCRKAPSRSTIKGLVHKFQVIGTVLDNN